MSEKIIVKAIISLLILLFIPVLGFLLFLQMPYDFYERFKSEGINSDFLKTAVIDEDLYYLKKKSVFNYSPVDTDKLWITLNFNDLNIPFPRNHPNIEFAPKPQSFRKVYFPNFIMRDNRARPIFHIDFIERKKINLSLPSDKIFRTPLVKKYINSLSQKKIINDIFNKKLDVKSYSLLDTFSLFSAWKESPPLELIYNIYIYKMRQRLFEVNITAFYNLRENFILYKLDKENSLLDGEYDFYQAQIFKNGNIHRLEFSVKKDAPMSNLILTRFVKEIDVAQVSTSDDSLKYYTFFKSLPYSERLSNIGLVYLYTAWSHDILNINFIREMIQFFERDSRNQSLLNPVYLFARDVAGTNFSNKDSVLDEDAQSRLKRGSEQEKKKEEMELGNFEMEDIENLSKEEKIKYLLKKGKRYKENEKDSVIED